MKKTIVNEIETFLNDYMVFPESSQSFVIALWTIATYMYPDFTAFPYLVVTSSTKQSGKSLLGIDLLGFVASNPRPVSAMTLSTLFRTIAQEKPTLLIDEAEGLNSEKNPMRPALNSGYRKGQTVPRTISNKVVNFPVYCPKVFVLIGDVYDTLRDRSIIITLKRSEEQKKRFVYEMAKSEGAELRDRIAESVENFRSIIIEQFINFQGIPYLTSRDEEIWTPLFVIASVICPDRMEELIRAAVDLSTEKTAEARSYTNLIGEGAENKALDDQYAKRLVADMLTIIGEIENQIPRKSKDNRSANRKVAIGTAQALDMLRAIPTAPWRKFRGKGIDASDLGAMLDRFGVHSKPIRIGFGRENSKLAKGYDKEQLIKAAKEAGLK